MTESDDDRTNRAVIEGFFAATERGDLAAAAAFIADDMVMEWPQSGERFRDRDHVLGAMRAVEVKPEFAGPPRLTGSDTTWVLMAPLRYGEELLHYVAVLELEAGRIGHATGYWAAPFPAAASRAPFAEPS